MEFKEVESDATANTTAGDVAMRGKLCEIEKTLADITKTAEVVDNSGVVAQTLVFGGLGRGSDGKAEIDRLTSKIEETNVGMPESIY